MRIDTELLIEQILAMDPANATETMLALLCASAYFAKVLGIPVAEYAEAAVDSHCEAHGLEVVTFDAKILTDPTRPKAIQVDTIVVMAKPWGIN